MILEVSSLPLALDYPSQQIGQSLIVHADCFEWLARLPENSLHAIVTDPPYGVKEYDLDQIEKMNNGRGGIWRIPPSFDGNVRARLPRFTSFNGKERAELQRFFVEWARPDYMIGCYFDRFHRSWSETELVWFETLIEEDDADIMGWTLGTLAVPAAYAGQAMARMQVIDYVEVAR